MKVDGTCHCGKISYEAEVDPATVVICHCTDCQTLSGSAFRVVARTAPGSFRLLSGMPRIYEKIADSGNRREQGFCPDCGSPIYSAPVGDGAKVHSLRVGGLSQRDALVPVDQYWVRSARKWLADIPRLPRQQTHAGSGPGGAFGR